MRRWVGLGMFLAIPACQASFDVYLDVQPTPNLPTPSATQSATATATSAATIPPVPAEPTPPSALISGTITLDECVPVIRSLYASQGLFQVVVPSFDGPIGERVFLHQTQASNAGDAGAFEMHLLGATATSSGNLVLLFPETLAHEFHSEGPSDRAQACHVPTYDQLTLDSNGKINVTAWNGSSGGILAIRALTMSVGGTLDAGGAGFRGGASAQSDLQNFTGTTTTDPLLAAEKGEGTDAAAWGLRGRGLTRNGGGGGNAGNGVDGGGGGGAGYGKGGNAAGNADKQGQGGQAVSGRGPFGGGGGGGHSVSGVIVGSGGRGGGFVFVDVVDTFSASSGAVLRASGADGSNSSGAGSGAGGGGGGGVIELRAGSCSGTYTLRLTGGNGGNGSGSPTYGGGGGGGGSFRPRCLTGAPTPIQELAGGAGGDSDPTNGEAGDAGAVVLAP